MTDAIVTHGSVERPYAPYVTIGISLFCVFSLILYSGLSPLMQQVMIEILGMRPAALSQLFEFGFSRNCQLFIIKIISTKNKIKA